MTELFNLTLTNNILSLNIPSTNNNYSNFQYIWQYSNDRIQWKDTSVTTSNINLSNDYYDKYVRCIISYDLSINWSKTAEAIITNNPKLNIKLSIGLIKKYPFNDLFFISEKYIFERKLNISQNLLTTALNLNQKLKVPFSGTFKPDNNETYSLIQKNEIIPEDAGGAQIPGSLFQKIETELGIEKTLFITKNINSLEFKLESYQWKKSTDTITWYNVTNNEIALIHGILNSKNLTNQLIPGDVVSDNGQYFTCLINYKNNNNVSKSYLVEMINQVSSLIGIEYELISESTVETSKNNINKNIISNTIDNKKILIGVEVNITENVNDNVNDIYKFTNSNNTLVYDNDKIITITVSNLSQNYSIEELVSFFDNNLEFSSIFKLTYSYKDNKIIISNNSKNNKYINFSKSTINELIGWFSDTKDILIESGKSITSIIQNPNPKLYTNINIENINSNKEDNTSYLENKIKYRQLINLKQGKWTNIALNNINIRDDFITYLKKFYIEKAYILDNNVYYDLFKQEYYDKYTERFKQFINSINRNDYIDNNNLINDSCWVKKNSPQINCIIIGIDYIGTEYELNGAIKDAKNMTSFLENYYGNQINIIKMIESDSRLSEQETPAELIPTAINIKQKLDDVTKEDKNIIFYFAGHIYKTYQSSESTEIDNSNENIRTLKGSDNDEIISDDWFYINFVKKIKATSKCRIYIDSCYSCGFSDFKYSYIDKKTIKENLTIDDNLLKELNNSKIELDEKINLLENLNNTLLNINKTIENMNNNTDYSVYKTSQLNILNSDKVKIENSIQTVTSEKNAKNEIYNQKVQQYNDNKSSNFADIISISSSNEFTKTYENNNHGLFTKELLQYLNEYGNFNIINAFDILSTTNLKATFIFEQEPILLL